MPASRFTSHSRNQAFAIHCWIFLIAIITCPLSEKVHGAEMTYVNRTDQNNPGTIHNVTITSPESWNGGTYVLEATVNANSALTIGNSAIVELVRVDPPLTSQTVTGSISGQTITNSGNIKFNATSGIGSAINGGSISTGTGSTGTVGLVNLDTGIVTAEGGSTLILNMSTNDLQSGRFKAIGTLILNGGILGQDSVVEGGGTVRVNCQINGDYNVSGLTHVTSAPDFRSGGNTQDFLMDGFSTSLRGAIPFVIHGIMDWKKGNIGTGGIASVLVVKNGINIIGADNKEFKGGELHNEGLIVQASAGPITFSTGATLKNLSTGTIELPASTNLLGAGLNFMNSGSVVKRDVGTSTITFNTTNLGVFRILSGTLRILNTGNILTQQSGSFRLEGGNFDGKLQLQGGEVKGVGSLTNLTNAGGHIKPGNEIGGLTVTSAFQQTSDGTLEIDLGGQANYDYITANGAANISGSLVVNLVDGFYPEIGNVFTFLSASNVTGSFSNVVLPALGSDRSWRVSYTTTSVILEVYANSSPQLNSGPTAIPNPVQLVP